MAHSGQGSSGSLKWYILPLINDYLVHGEVLVK